MMFDLADAIAVLPGGFGTLDETFEVLTWKQIGMHDKPIVLIDVAGYWRPLEGVVHAIVGAGFARREHSELFTFAATPDEALNALARSPAPHIPADSARF
jgi:uncharacterized protein (TIGR00730 family)